MATVIGIDLGTTNSVTAVKKVTAAPIKNAEGDLLTPSAVTAVPKTDNQFDYIVGRHSRELQKQYPEQTVLSVKRLMGREFEDHEVQKLIKNNQFAYHIETDPTEPGSIYIPLGGKKQTPEMISGLILKKLIADSEAELKATIDGAVITVPAYFSDRQKFATRAACDYAGIKLLRLLPEPTAAALSFGLAELPKDVTRTVMVFDLGGGTFDISVLTLSGGSFMEITKGGDMWLGGDNIDTLIMHHVFSMIEKEELCKPISELIELLSPSDKARFLVEIKEKSENCKIELSTKHSANIALFGILKDENGQLIDIDVTIKRDELNDLLKPMTARITEIASQILNEIRFEPELIDTVMMVGGSSLIPAIKDALCNMFGSEKVLRHPRPLSAIAEGAAFMAAKLAGEKTVEDAFALMHSTSHDYFLQLADGKKHLLVAKNTPLPIQVEQKLTFAQDDQVIARIRIFNEVNHILETVGELWLHKDQFQQSLYSNNKNKKTEFCLRFSVDEDNIIVLTVWPVGREDLIVTERIARGGLAIKLYHDMERALSTTIADSYDRSSEIDALMLARCVINTIQAVSDPMTGQTNPEQKLKAQRQINVLCALGESDIAPTARLEFAKVALQQTQQVLPEEKYAQFQKIVGQYTQHLSDFESIEVLETIDDELDNFYKDTPAASLLGHAECFSESIEEDYPGVARKIRDQAKIYIKLSQDNAEDALKECAEEAIQDLMRGFTSSDIPSGRFDRDVRI